MPWTYTKKCKTCEHFKFLSLTTRGYYASMYIPINKNGEFVFGADLLPCCKHPKVEETIGYPFVVLNGSAHNKFRRIKGMLANV